MQLGNVSQGTCDPPLAALNILLAQVLMVLFGVGAGETPGLGGSV